MAEREPVRLLLAVDPSRKHADTQHWVREVARLIPAEAVVPTARVHTTTPTTVRELGLPIRTSH
jgi:hypothetical protein